ncbi:MAG TPA: MBL fold metallo-hydrolase [Chloroflexota bacterium]|nr:MBL fold metallo-hydrolase [Chloroflexota bacterium]
MDLTWLGHACFRLRGRDVTILTDPYEGGDWGYPPLTASANVVTISNDHPHHAGLSGIDGRPRVLRGPGEYEIGGALVWGVRTHRRKDDAAATSATRNTAFVIQLEELTVCHLGDLADAPLNAEELARLQNADVLLIPVGGNCTINATQAAAVVAQVEPKIIVPMHYATDETRGHLTLDDIERFCKELGATEATPRARLSITQSSLPNEPTVMLLEKSRRP